MTRIALLDSIHTYMTGEPHERTGALKNAASCMVDARVHFQTSDGDMDILGRSAGYRAWISEALDASPLPKARHAAFLSATRHHVSVRLRAMFGPEQLEMRGISREDAVSRARLRRREKAMATLRREDADAEMSLGSEKPLTSPEEIVKFLDAVTERLRMVRPTEHHHDVNEALDHLGTELSAAQRRARVESHSEPDDIVF